MSSHAGGARRSSEALTAARHLATALERVEYAIRSQPLEHGAILAPNGDVLHRMLGTRDGIDITDEAASKMPGAIFTHNHPGQRSFSVDDGREAAFHDVAEMRAVTNTWRYSLRPAAGNVWPHWRTIEMNYHVHEQAVVTRLTARIRGGTLTPHDADAIHHHLVWQAVARDMGLVYRRTRWKD